nr:hypothetical protein [uncultured Roseateles sp.]
MKSKFRWLGWALTVLALTLLLMLALALQGKPLIAQQAEVNAADVERANAFLRRNDPRMPRPGTLRTLVMSEQDLNLLLNELMRHKLPDTSAQIVLGAGIAQVRASVGLHPHGLPLWLNLDADLRESTELPVVDRLRIGRLPVPGWAARWWLESLRNRLSATTEGQLANDLVKSVQLRPAWLQLNYEWRDDTYGRMLGALVPQAEQTRLKAYSDRLAELSAELSDQQPANAGPGGVPLVRLLPPLFELAQTRSGGGGDAAAENRAALLTLALHASGRGLKALVPAARDWRQPRAMPVTLYGRDDFPQHLLISAVLAFEGGGPLADAIGVYKEVADSRGGSGFSFNDIAADRAGSRLGLLAKNAPERLQARLARPLQEAQFMPDVSDLPEFLRAEDFQKTYGGVGAPAYQQMLAEIERRLDATELFKP